MRYLYASIPSVFEFCIEFNGLERGDRWLDVDLTSGGLTIWAGATKIEVSGGHRLRILLLGLPLLACAIIGGGLLVSR